MGSAHFLVEVISYINGRIEEFNPRGDKEILKIKSTLQRPLQDLENLLKEQKKENTNEWLRSVVSTVCG